MMGFLANLIDAVTRGSIPPEAALWMGLPLDQMPEPPPRGMSYVCRRCDVFGYAGASEPKVCWCCDSDEKIEQR